MLNVQVNPRTWAAQNFVFPQRHCHLNKNMKKLLTIYTLGVPVVELKCMLTVETALGKGMFTLFHSWPAMFS